MQVIEGSPQSSQRQRESSFEDCLQLLTFPWVVRDDSVFQTARCMSYWGCAVLHGVQLIQSAWLKARGHEQQITGGSDLCENNILSGLWWEGLPKNVCKQFVPSRGVCKGSRVEPPAMHVKQKMGCFASLASTLRSKPHMVYHLPCETLVH